MNFHHLILQRDALLRQARLANAAYAYQRLGEFAARIARARLRGAVVLKPGDPAGDQPWPGFTALEGSPAVLAEHFLDEEVVELADILGFLGEELPVDGLALRLEELGERWLPPLRQELEAAGVTVAPAATPAEDPNRTPGQR